MNKLAKQVLEDVLVIGVGNPLRGDDGLGHAATQAIEALSLPFLITDLQEGEALSLMESWENYNKVYLIDAMSSGQTPGTIIRFDADLKSLPTEYFDLSTHSFGVAQAIELARALGRLPKKLIVYAVEGMVFDSGSGLSEPVAAALGEIVTRIKDEIDH